MALVLGALSPKGEISVNNTDLNDYTSMGEWSVNVFDLVNAPASASQGGWYSGNLFVISGGVAQGGNPLIQILTQGSKMWFRNKWVSSWTPWVMVSTDIPYFYKNYASLTSLSDALNAFRCVELPQAGTNLVDWNSVKGYDFSWFTTWYNDMENQNYPSAGVMICFINTLHEQSSQFRKLYIMLSYAGGIKHSYDLETWV